ncbi:hypothetical protein KXV31_007911, partial [Aspergillus fumigatus]
AHLHRSSRLQAVTSVLVTELPPDLWNGELLAHLYSRFNEGPTEVILPGEDMHAARKTELDSQEYRNSTTAIANLPPEELDTSNSIERSFTMASYQGAGRS